MIRISGGKYRSRKLETPNVLTTKPTMDKVRAAVFNILTNDIKNTKVLDLYAGSGSYGFEALSRGAKEVTFIDSNKEAISVIKKNAMVLNETNIKIINGDAITNLTSLNEKFNIVFADPPYKLEVFDEITNLLENNDLLEKNAIVVFESDKDIEIRESINKKVKSYKYGLARIYVIRYF